VITVLSWGTWLLPLHRLQAVDERKKTFWLTTGIMGFSFCVAMLRGFQGITLGLFVSAFLGGIVWSCSGLAAVKAVSELGLARAMGIWSPLNVLWSLVWGAILFSEFKGWPLRQVGKLVFGVVLMVIGILLIANAHSSEEGKKSARNIRVGLACALVAGVGWGSYFLPIRWSEASPWVTAFPMAIGMWAGSLLPVLWSWGSNSKSDRTLVTYAFISALLWSCGNYGSLLLMEAIGTGRGFTVAQGCLMVNALVGVFLLKDPAPGSPAGESVLVGVLLAALGAMIVGMVKG